LVVKLLVVVVHELLVAVQLLGVAQLSPEEGLTRLEEVQPLERVPKVLKEYLLRTD